MVMSRYRLSPAGLLALLAITSAAIPSAWAGSSIDPTIPAANSPLVAAPMRANFAAAYADINHILNEFAGSAAPANPSAYQRWADISTTPPTIRQFDGLGWVALGALDGANHAWIPPLGGGTTSLAAAGTTNIWGVPQASVTITGSTGITNFGPGATIGQLKVLTFTGTPTLTHSSPTLVLPGSVNIAAAAGDVAIVQATSGGATVVGYQRADGTLLARAPANTMAGNWTGSTGAFAANPMPSCADSAGAHLNYVSGTGIICGGSTNTAAIQAQPYHGTFWNSSYIDRQADRLFLGPAVANDGAFYPSGCPSCNGTAFTNLDWLAQLQFASYNGGPGIAQNGNYAQIYALSDNSAAYASPSTLVTGVPIATMVLGAQTAGLKTGATTYPLGPVCVNNSSGGQHPSCWAIYAEAHRVTGDAGPTQGMEIEIRNSASSVTGWTPTNFPGTGSIGISVGCGAGLASTGQFPCSVGQYFAAAPMSFGAGLIFADGAIGAYGTAGSKPAIEMPYDNSVQWWNGGSLTGALYTTNTGVLEAVSPSGTEWKTGIGGSSVASLDGTGKFTATGGLQVTGTVTLPSNSLALSNLAQSAANTMLGNWTGGSANVTANAMPSCTDSGGSHLNYVSGTGITCGSSTGAAAAGSLTGATLAAGVTASSLTSVGTLTGLNVTAAAGLNAVFKSTGSNSATIGVDVASAGQVDAFNLSDAGTLKWQIQKTAANGLLILDNANSKNALAITSAGAVTIGEASGTLTLQAGTLNINATPGLSCSGTPTASFASTNGIVTHC